MSTVQSDTDIESDDTFSLNIDNINDTSFEFPCLSHEINTYSVTADEIFSEGKIRPVFKSIHSDDNQPFAKNVCKPPVKSLTRRSLSCLFTEDKDFNTDDQLDGVPIDTYCKWTPPESNSTRNSKKWKLPSLLRRCSSDGRDCLSFYDSNEDVWKGHKCASGKVDGTVLEHFPSKKVEKFENQRRSYLPYKQGLIAFFANLSNKSGNRKWERSKTLPS